MAARHENNMQVSNTYQVRQHYDTTAIKECVGNYKITRYKSIHRGDHFNLLGTRLISLAFSSLHLLLAVVEGLTTTRAGHLEAWHMIATYPDQIHTLQEF